MFKIHCLVNSILIYIRKIFLTILNVLWGYFSKYLCAIKYEASWYCYHINYMKIVKIFKNICGWNDVHFKIIINIWSTIYDHFNPLIYKHHPILICGSVPSVTKTFLLPLESILYIWGGTWLSLKILSTISHHYFRYILWKLYCRWYYK